MKSLIGYLLLLSFAFSLHAQDLMNSRIRKISDRKRSIYIDQGIFHSGNSGARAILKKLRHSSPGPKGYERLVLDFKGKQTPKIYGYVNGQDKKLYIDLFDTSMEKGIGSFGSTEHIKSVNFYAFADNSTSLEVDFKTNVAVDIFYLQNPGRLVVDIKQ
jgi:hypothetical protein